MIMRIFSFILLLILLQGNIYGQKDTVDSYIPPPKYKFDFIFSNGLLQKSQFNIEQGIECVYPATNRYWKGQVAVTRDLGNNLKLGAGVHFGLYGFELSYETKKEDFPFLPKDHSFRGEYVYFSYPYDYFYIGLPLRISYNLLRQEKHQLWLDVGLGLYYQSRMETRSGYSVSNDSTTMRMLGLNYIINPENGIRAHYELGLQYRYQLKNYHELVLGISTSYNPKPIFSGDYTLLPNIMGLDHSGTFDHYLNYVGLDIGYSINWSKIAFKKENFKKANKNKKRFIPGTIKDKNEVRFGYNLWNLSHFPIKQQSGNIKATTRANANRSFVAEVLFAHYFNKDRAWYTGASYRIEGNYCFFDLTKYKPLISLETEHSFYFLDERIGVPIGLLQQIQLNSRSTIEFREELQLLIGYYNWGDGDHWEGYVYDDQHTKRILYKTDSKDYNWVVPGLNINAAYVYKNRNQNKWIIGAKLAYSPISNYKVDYQLLQNDGSYANGSIVYRPFSINFYVQHALSFKKRRFLMANY